MFNPNDPKTMTAADKARNTCRLIIELSVKPIWDRPAECRQDGMYRDNVEKALRFAGRELAKELETTLTEEMVK